MNYLTSLLFCSCLVAWALFPSTSKQLSAQASEKTASKPLFRDPVYDGAADPVLVWNRSEKRWQMFYTNRRANAPNLSKVTWVHGTRIGIATSTDQGATWKYEGVADITYGKPDYTQWAPDIIDNQGTYHMYIQ